MKTFKDILTEKTNKFKVGDIVKVRKDAGNDIKDNLKGKTGVIQKIRGDNDEFIQIGIGPKGKRVVVFKSHMLDKVK